MCTPNSQSCSLLEPHRTSASRRQHHPLLFENNRRFARVNGVVRVSSRVWTYDLEAKKAKSPLRYPLSDFCSSISRHSHPVTTFDIRCNPNDLNYNPCVASFLHVFGSQFLTLPPQCNKDLLGFNDILSPRQRPTIHQSSPKHWNLR